MRRAAPGAAGFDQPKFGSWSASCVNDEPTYCSGEAHVAFQVAEHRPVVGRAGRGLQLRRRGQAIAIANAGDGIAAGAV